MLPHITGHQLTSILGERERRRTLHKLTLRNGKFYLAQDRFVPQQFFSFLFFLSRSLKHPQNPYFKQTHNRIVKGYSRTQSLDSGFLRFVRKTDLKLKLFFPPIEKAAHKSDFNEANRFLR